VQRSSVKEKRRQAWRGQRQGTEESRREKK
jgi:hypothetical protein